MPGCEVQMVRGHYVTRAGTEVVPLVRCLRPLKPEAHHHARTSGIQTSHVHVFGEGASPVVRKDGRINAWHDVALALLLGQEDLHNRPPGLISRFEPVFQFAS